MSELDRALASLTAWLTQHGIRHMVIGGFAVTIWGEPRFTPDLDITVSVPVEQIAPSVQLIASQFPCLAAEPVRFVAETRVLPIMLESVPVKLIFAALPYEDEAISRARSINL